MTSPVDRARELLEAATPGPWKAELDMFHDNVIAASVSNESVSLLAILDTEYEVKDSEGPWTSADDQRRDALWMLAREGQELRDATFIAAAPDLVRDLLAEVGRLERERDCYRKTLGTIRRTAAEYETSGRDYAAVGNMQAALSAIDERCQAALKKGPADGRDE